MALQRLTGTRIHWATFDLVEGERWEYAFRVFEDERLDPRNSQRVTVAEDSELSVVELPGYVAPVLPSPCATCPRGKLDAVEVTSQMPGRKYQMKVYTPPGHAPGGPPLPLLLVTYGADAQRFGGMVDILDAMVGRDIRPLVVVFLELPDAAWYEQNRIRVREILDQDVMPYLEAHYRLSRTPADRAIWAPGYSLDNALLWALLNGVGKLASSSPEMGERSLERVLGPALDGAPDMSVRLDWGRSDARNPHFGLDVDRQGRELVERLRSGGHAVTFEVTPGGGSWTRWRAQIPGILRAFFAR